MSDAKEVKEVEFSLKVFINKEKTKVLFAEVENDFADVLLSFLKLPLGKIVKVMEKHYGDKAPSIGSLNSLYNGWSNPDMANLWRKRGKEELKDPCSCENHSLYLKLNVDYTKATTYVLGKPYKGVFTSSSASFIISDDLRMVPNIKGSIMQTLSTLGVDITDLHGVELRNVTVGLKEVIHLLKGSLLSRTPLSDLALDEGQTKFATIKSEGGISLDHIDNRSPTKLMKLKVMFQKSTKKLLFAQAEEYFVDFLYSLLIIPLGLVEWLLGSNTGLNNIDNLHKSIADHIEPKYLKDSDTKGGLLKPKVSRTYSRNCFLPLGKEGRPPTYSYDYEELLFVEGSRMYMVTDDLTVTRLLVSSSISLLNEMNISLSDVEEVEMKIGLEEALSILKASLTSTTALTDGLVVPKLKKQAKQEN